MASSARYYPLRPGGWAVAALSTLLAALTGAIAPAQAVDPEPAPEPRPAEVLLNQLIEIPSEFEIGNEYQQEQDARWPIVTEEDADPQTMTIPSLWWRRDQLPGRWLSPLPGQRFIQFDGYRLVTEWRAFRSGSTGAHMVDIQVDPQYWERLGGIQQYAILNQLGTGGASYGYQVRVYNAINLVGIHACDFSAVPGFAGSPQELSPEAMATLPCAISLGPFFQLDESLFEDDLFAPP